MKKRIVSLIALLGILVSVAPAVAADTNSDYIDKAMGGGLVSELLDYTFDTETDISKIGGMICGGNVSLTDDGKSNKYLSFDGTGNTVFTISSGSEVISYEADVTFNNLSDFNIFDVKINDGTADKWGISAFKSVSYFGKYYFNCYGRTSYTIEKGKTYHLMAAVKQGDDGFVNYYVNGEKIKSQKLTPPPQKIIVTEISSGSEGSIKFDNFKVKAYVSGSIFDSEITRTPALSQRPSQQKIAEDFKKNNVHPRIIADIDDFEALKIEIRENSDKKVWYESMISKAQQLLYAKTLVYELRDGERLMYVSSEFEERMVVLGLAYRLTGDKKYAEKAYTDLEAIASFQDWHPKHHIDTGIMAAGFAIGYDWFYDSFSDSQRKVLEDGIDKNGFKDIILSYQTTKSDMDNAAYVQDNHNAMCNGGAILAALAFYDVFPDKCRYILSNGIRGLEEMMWRYAPDGAWFEGSMYGAICINYLSMAFSSMEKCLGNLYGLDSVQGFDRAYDYIADTQSQVASYNFGDSDYMSRVYCYSGWISKHFGKAASCKLIGGGTAVSGEQLAFAVLWNDSEAEYATPKSRLYNTENAPLKLLILRDGTEKNETYAGIKAGDTVCEHSQLDSGSFVFDSQGVRWACDMGKDNYNLPGFWDTSSGRWKIFLNRAEAHNTIVINPKNNDEPDYNLGSSARFDVFKETDGGAIASLDMSELLANSAESAKRAFCFTDNRKSLVVRDELEVGTETKDIYWMFYTRADMIKDGANRVILTDKNSPEKKLSVDFICNDGENDIPAEVVYEKAQEMKSRGVSGQSENTGYYRMALKINASGRVNITVKLTPINTEGSSVSEYDIPINSWSENIINSDSEELTYILPDDGERAELIAKATFDTKADITDPYKSMLNTNARTTPRFNYSMEKDGQSDVVTVVADENGNRIGKLVSKKNTSVFENIQKKDELVFCDLDSVSKQGKIVRYDVDLKFPDFLQDKYIFETKYINAQNTSTWFAQECLIVQPYEENLGMLCVNDNRSDYLAVIEKDKWYKFSVEYDFANSEVRFYADGALVASRTAPNGISKILKADIKLVSSDTGSQILIDNFEVSRIPYPTRRLDCYAGNSCLKAAIISDSDFDIYIAEYLADGTLNKIRKESLAEGEYLRNYSVLENTEGIKVMMWNKDGMVPMCTVRKSR